MLKKIGRWTSGRLQGSKGVKKYDDWMKRNPWASTALAVGDVALSAYAAPKLLSGAGKLKGMLTGGRAAGTTAQTAANAGRAAQAFTEATVPTGTTSLTAPRVMTVTPKAVAPFSAPPMTSVRGLAPEMLAGTRNALGAGVQSLPASLRATVPTIANAPTALRLQSLLAGAGDLTKRGLGGAWQFAKDNPLPTAMALQGAFEGYGSAQDRRLERDLMNRQFAQQKNLAQLLIPLYQQYYGGR